MFPPKAHSEQMAKDTVTNLLDNMTPNYLGMKLLFMPQLHYILQENVLRNQIATKQNNTAPNYLAIQKHETLIHGSSHPTDYIM